MPNALPLLAPSPLLSFTPRNRRQLASPLTTPPSPCVPCHPLRPVVQLARWRLTHPRVRPHPALANIATPVPLTQTVAISDPTASLLSHMHLRPRNASTLVNARLHLDPPQIVRLFPYLCPRPRYHCPTCIERCRGCKIRGFVSVGGRMGWELQEAACARVELG